jgi:predicted nucleic acid-binding protein
VIVVADTPGIIAASDGNAPEHLGCQEILRHAGTVVLSALVLAEVDHLAKVRFGAWARTAVIDFIVEQARRDRFVIAPTDLPSLETARKVQQQYADLKLDLADAVNVALAAEYRTDVILTLDRRDFRVVRPLTAHNCFRLLPDDAEKSPRRGDRASR